MAVRRRPAGPGPGPVAGPVAGPVGRQRAEQQRAIGLQDLLVQVAQQRAGLDAQLVDQLPPRRAVGGQRGGLLPGPVQREHEQLVQPLPQWLGRGQRLQLDHDLAVPPQVQVRVNPGLERVQPHLGQPRHLGHGQHLRGHVRQRLAPP
jgi:hypothetical protein